MEITATGSKARWAPQAMRKAYGWSWAAACSVPGRGHIVAAYSLLILMLLLGPRSLCSEENLRCKIAL